MQGILQYCAVVTRKLSAVSNKWRYGMLLSDTEREHKINDFLRRKFKEFDMDDDSPVKSNVVRSFQTHRTNA